MSGKKQYRSFVITKTKHMKLTKEQLEKLALEINKDWIGGYEASVLEYHLQSDDYEYSCALIITLNNGHEFHCKLYDNYKIECDDIMTINQLNYMLSR